MYNQFLIDKIIKNALIEDMNYGDITTDSLIDENHMSEAIIKAKEEGIVAGLPIAQRVFQLMDKDILFDAVKEDGDPVAPGENMAIIKGRTKSILKGERLALNFLQRMSGIASLSKKYADIVQHTLAKVVDTRKTTPGLRALEKYAVRMGGCHNHRFNLSDAVMIKDNHIKAMGSITKAIEKIRENIPHTVKIEVEVESLDQLQEAITAKADIAMLDNMDLETMGKAVEMTKGRLILEASGNITMERLKLIAELGIDVISIGALTHSAKSLDISLNIKE